LSEREIGNAEGKSGLRQVKEYPTKYERNTKEQLTKGNYNVKVEITYMQFKDTKALTV